MDTELKHTRISVLVHGILGVVAAYVAVQVDILLAGVIGIVLLVAVGYPLERLVGKRGFKWWFANGIFIYLLLWLVVWIYLFNL